MNTREVIERKNAEIEAVRLASIVESSTDAIYSYSLNFDFLTWNHDAQRIYGYTPQEAIGQKLYAHCPGQSNAGIYSSFGISEGWECSH